jgi:hypothetical protein
VQEDIAKVKCKHCGDDILKSHEAVVKLRTKLLKWTPEGMFAVCKSCGADVPMDFDLLKSINTRFVYEVKKT